MKPQVPPPEGQPVIITQDVEILAPDGELSHVVKAGRKGEIFSEHWKGQEDINKVCPVLIRDDILGMPIIKLIPWEAMELAT